MSACEGDNNNSNVNFVMKDESSIVTSTSGGITTQMTTTTESETTTEVTTSEVQTETSLDDLEVDEVDNKWALFLVNQTHVLPSDYEITTKAIFGDYVIDERAADYAIKMFDAAEADGVGLTVISAYRTVEYQENLFERGIEKRENQGMTYDEAYAETAENVAIPGQSEHNAGLAIDILSNECWNLTEEFENTQAFEWLSENAQDYGFILRYPRGKEEITGITYEPWHYRFIGVYHANKVKESGLCLEEYIANLEN